MMYRCPICGAATTARGVELLGPLCWLCNGRLYRDDAPDPTPAGPWLRELEARQRHDALAESEA